MNEKNFQQLIQDNPDLFYKNDKVYFSVGDGWYNIISCLCQLISSDVNSARGKLEYYEKNSSEFTAEEIAGAEANLKLKIEELPYIEDVKEKFGTLRFYVSGGKEDIHKYISFAELMSSLTCEECGNPGVRRSGGWLKVLCDKHHELRNNNTMPI